jgi:hypothetical protein
MTMSRPQFTLRSLLVAMLVVGAFCGGIAFERERQRRRDGAKQTVPGFMELPDGTLWKEIALPPAIQGQLPTSQAPQ